MPTSEPHPSRSDEGPAKAFERQPVEPLVLAWRLAESLSDRNRRRLAFALLEGDGEGTISFRRDGIRWTAFTWDTYVSSTLFAEGSFHGAELAAAVAWIARHRIPGPDAVIVNVGAHIGTSAIPLARGSGCRVLAIEPEPENFALLGQNVRDNGLDDRIACVRLAIALARDRVELVLPRANSGGPEVVPPGRPPSFLRTHPVRRVVDVPAARLSAILDAQRILPDTVPLVWSDTQGSEIDVIESAPPLWAAGVPLYTEFDPDVLGAHEATGAFVRAATAHFAGFAVDSALVARGADVEVRPMAEFATACGSFARPTNVLLVPRPRAAR